MSNAASGVHRPSNAAGLSSRAVKVKASQRSGHAALWGHALPQSVANLVPTGERDRLTKHRSPSVCYRFAWHLLPCAPPSTRRSLVHVAHIRDRSGAAPEEVASSHDVHIGAEPRHTVRDDRLSTEHVPPSPAREYWRQVRQYFNGGGLHRTEPEGETCTRGRRRPHVALRLVATRDQASAPGAGAHRSRGTLRACPTARFGSPNSGPCGVVPRPNRGT